MTVFWTDRTCSRVEYYLHVQCFKAVLRFSITSSIPAPLPPQIAERLRMWDLCLESLALSGYRGAAAESLARSLWDRLLKSRLADVWNASGPPTVERLPADPGASEDEDDELYGEETSYLYDCTMPVSKPVCLC